MFPMAAAMLAAIIGLSGFSAFSAGRRTTSLIEQQVANVARTLTDSNFPLTPPVLRQMQGFAGATFVLVDEDGNRISSDSDLDTSVLPGFDASTSSGEVEFVDTIRVGSDQYYHTLLALPRRGSELQRQSLHVLYPERAYRDAWQSAAQPPLVMGAASLGIVALIALVIASRVSRPLRRLRMQIGRIAEGDFAPVPLPQCDDEVRDLATAVNRMAQMLESYEKEVRQTEKTRTLGHLVRGIAHQLRNSATGAQMALDIHREECPRGEESESLEVAARQLAFIEKYLQKFLSLDARSPRAYTSVDFCELVNGLVPLLRPTAKHVAVDMQVLMPKTGLVVHGDKDALEHVVLNLLMNAIEAAGRGKTDEATVCAEVSAITEQRLRLTVDDSGDGPASEIASAVFEPFVTDKPHGTGLGLSLAKDIVEAHQGSVSWERCRDRTRFLLEIPLLPGDARCQSC